MARPVQADPAVTRARILEAASALFADDGIAETSMRTIARAAGVSMATIHHYYGGKADLYAACVDAMYEELTALQGELDGALSRPLGDLRGLIDVAVRRAYAFARRHRATVRLMVRTVLDTGALPDDRRERHLRPFLDRGAALLAPLTGRDPMSVRLTLLSINHLITRYALGAPEELALVLLGRADATDEAERLVADHLVELACAQLIAKGPA